MPSRFFSFFSKPAPIPALPKQVATYLACFEKPNTAREWVVFDTETTGLLPTKDRMVSIGAVVVKDDSIILKETHEWFIHVENQTAEGVAVHGVLARDDFQPEADVLLEWLNFIQNRPLVAHHAAFDVAMVNHALERHFGIKMKNSVLDTAQLALKKEHYGRIPDAYLPDCYTLDNLLLRYKIPVQDRHTALGDALATALLFLKLT